MASPIRKRIGANLPHWTAEGASYAVTFRLADSLPEGAPQRIQARVAELRQRVERGAGLALPEQVLLARLTSDATEELLHAGHGACWLARTEAAQIVADAMRFFHGKRYQLLAWCVMPNHVHAVLTPIAGHALPDILHSWKSFTAKRVNTAVGRTGTLWQAESYDHLVRDNGDLLHHIHYTRDNPSQAGLKDWPWVG